MACMKTEYRKSPTYKHDNVVYFKFDGRSIHCNLLKLTNGE